MAGLAAEQRSLEAVFAAVRSQTAFEETVDRLGTAIKLGLLAPGTRLPPERELCSQLGIARSTLRQALTALTESGLLYAVRGRGGGTFVADPLPPADAPSPALLATWREACDMRLAIELAVAALAAERADAGGPRAAGRARDAHGRPAGPLRRLPPGGRALPHRPGRGRPAAPGWSRRRPSPRAR